MDDHRRVSLLLVDDEPLVLSSLRRCLRRAAADIRTALTADEALVLVAAEVPDLVISDYRMPGSMNGLDFLNRIHVEHPRVTCVLHTGELGLAAANGRPFEVLTKPCAPEVLLTLIESVRATCSSRP